MSLLASSSSWSTVGAGQIPSDGGPPCRSRADAVLINESVRFDCSTACRIVACGALVVCCLLCGGRARAQDVPPEVKLQPVVEEAETMGAIDLHDIVLSATKSISTVQETPAIVTIITAEDIRRWG